MYTYRHTRTQTPQYISKQIHRCKYVCIYTHTKTCAHKCVCVCEGSASRREQGQMMCRQVHGSVDRYRGNFPKSQTLHP